MNRVIPGGADVFKVSAWRAETVASVEPYVYDLPVPMHKPRVTSSTFSWKPIVLEWDFAVVKIRRRLPPIFYSEPEIFLRQNAS
jgi:hypothetical protein